MKIRQAKKIIKRHSSGKPNYWNGYDTSVVNLITQFENQRLFRALCIVCRFIEPPSKLNPKT